VREPVIDLNEPANEMAFCCSALTMNAASERREPAATTSSAVSSNARLDRPRAECCHRDLTRQQRIPQAGVTERRRLV